MPSYDAYGNLATGQTLGHFYAAQRSGELAATIGALGHLARIRWDAAGSFCVLKRIRAAIGISGAVTTAVEFNLRAIVVRGFSVDFTTAMTAVAPSRARSGTMQPSQMAVGPAISTTTVMSGQTLTADAAPFAIQTFPMLQPVTATGTAVALPVGAGVQMVDLYKQEATGQHPIVLGQNEGVVIQPVTAGPASGTFALYVVWEWAEVLAF